MSSSLHSKNIQKQVIASIINRIIGNWLIQQLPDDIVFDESMIVVQYSGRTIRIQTSNPVIARLTYLGQEVRHHQAQEEVSKIFSNHRIPQKVVWK